MSALARAFTLALAMQAPGARSVVLPPEAVRQGVAKRLAAQACVNARPITVLAPLPETDATVHDFAIAQFTPAAQRLAR